MRHIAALLLLLALLASACTSEDGGSDDFAAEDFSDTSDVAAGAPAPSAQNDTAGDAAVEVEVEVEAPDEIDLDAPLPPEEAREEPPSTANPWVSTAEDPLSTFGLDVDTISYVRIRESIGFGQLPDPSSIRVEEVINTFDYDYPTDADAAFTVTADTAQWPYSSDDGTRHLLRIGIATPVPDGRQPTDLVFVIDTSGSMTDLLPLVKDSLRILVGNLNDDDTVAIVEYSDSARPLLPSTPVSDADRILSVIDELQTGGSTALAAGLTAGYRLAEQANTQGRTSRVIILSDGIANVGATDTDAILNQIEDAGDRGINLLTVGFGLFGFNDTLMEQLADRGDGFAAYVDGIEEAEELFGTRLTSTLQTYAVEARTQIEFSPQATARYRLVGFENRDIADEDFRDDSIDAGEIGAGHSVTALYELELVDGADGPIGTVNLRWLDPETREPTETSHVIDSARLTAWEDAPAGLRLAGVAGAWAEVLRESPYAPPGGVPSLVSEASRLASALDSDDIVEWAELVSASAELR